MVTLNMFGVIALPILFAIIGMVIGTVMGQILGYRERRLEEKNTLLIEWNGQVYMVGRVFWEKEKSAFSKLEVKVVGDPLSAVPWFGDQTLHEALVVAH